MLSESAVAGPRYRWEGLGQRGLRACILVMVRRSLKGKADCGLMEYLIWCAAVFVVDEVGGRVDGQQRQKLFWR